MLDDDPQRDDETVGRADDLDAALGPVPRHEPPHATATRGRPDDAVALGSSQTHDLRDGLRGDRDLPLYGSLFARVGHARRLDDSDLRHTERATYAATIAQWAQTAFCTLPERKQRVQT